MSGVETGGPRRLADSEAARRLLDGWVESLAQVFESMAGERPEIHWRPAEGPLPSAQANEPEILWWEQPFQGGADALVWVGAPRPAWEYAGGLTLQAAGLEKVDAEEARNTWLEILGQSLSAMARAAGALVGREVSCGTGAERPPGPQAGEAASVTLKFAGASPDPLTLAFSSKFMGWISGPSEQPPDPSEAGEEALPSPVSSARSKTMDLLLEIELPVSISFGKIQIPMRDVLKLTTGSIVELDRDVNEPVEVLVNHCLIARGEVVVVEGNYAVRIQQIASRQDRLRSVR
jgi:flagellar motor switch protein FliN/FliY